MGCNGCVDCIGVLSCGKKRWADEDIGRNPVGGEKK
jgi:hypothetical protein